MAKSLDRKDQGSGKKKNDETGNKPTKLIERFVFNFGKRGLKVSVIRWNEGDPHLSLNYWHPDKNDKTKNDYIDVYSEGNWRKLKRFVDGEFPSYLGWGGFDLAESDIDSVRPEKKKDDLLKAKDAKIKKKTKRIAELQKENAELEEIIKKRVKEIHKSKIPQYKKELEEFRELLNSSEKEAPLHKFLRDHIWIFNPIYSDASSEPRIGFTSRSDFLLHRYDGFADVVELKKSNDPIFLKNGAFSKEAKNAISQMIKYLFNTELHLATKKFEIDMKLKTEEEEPEMLKSEGLIFVGRRGNQSMMRHLRLHNHYLNHMRIITYDELLSVAERTIKNFEGMD